MYNIKIHVVLLNSNLLMSLLLVFGHLVLHKPLCSARRPVSLMPSTTAGMERRGAVAEGGHCTRSQIASE